MNGGNRILPAEHGGKVKNSGAVLIGVGFELLIVHWAVRGTEIYCSIRYLFNARSGPEGLVVDLYGAELFVVFVEPLRVNRVRKCCARAIDGKCRIRPQNTGDCQNY